MLFFVKRIRYPLFFVLLFSWFFIECFVVKRENRIPSANILKEECCQELGAIVDLGAQVIKELANMQQTSLKTVQDFIQGSKDNVISKASRKELSAIHNEVCGCRQQLENILSQLRKYEVFLQNLEQNALPDQDKSVQPIHVKTS